jgi:formate/nitrite transporter
MPEGPPMRDERFHHDPLLPAETARKAEAVGVAKAEMDTLTLLALAVLAGAFIAFGAIFMTVTLAGSAGLLPFGVLRMLAGVAFSLGLILVVIGGAELFTGNNLMVMAWASGAIPLRALMRAWSIVYVGNFVGAAGTALLVFLSGHYLFGNGSVGRVALAVADMKCAIPFFRALMLGILCNVLVCLAIWLSYSARTVVGKVAVIVPPISAFVAAGFEHSIANMYLIPTGLLIKWFAGAEAWALLGADTADFPALSLGAFFGNLAATTIGNMIGGGGLVAGVYWFVYLRRR